MNVRSQVSMVFHLDKCIGCHTCSLACKNLWTSRPGAEYMWWNNVETKPGTGYPTLYEDQEQYRGDWEVKDGELRLKLNTRAQELLNISYNPHLPALDDYYEPWTYNYGDLIDAPLQEDQPVFTPISLVTGKEMEIEAGPNWDDDLGWLRHICGQRSEPQITERRRKRTSAGRRADRILLPPAHLQSLRESELCGGMSCGCHLQAWRGWHRAGQPGKVHGLANVHLGLSIQKGLLQLGDRQVREVHPVLSPA